MVGAVERQKVEARAGQQVGRSRGELGVSLLPSATDRDREFQGDDDGAALLVVPSPRVAHDVQGVALRPVRGLTRTRTVGAGAEEVDAEVGQRVREERRGGGGRDEGDEERGEDDAEDDPARDGDPWLDEILAVRRSISGACSPASAMVDPGARSPPDSGVVVLAPARSRLSHRWTARSTSERPNHATSDAPPFVQNKTERGARAGVATVAGALSRCQAAREVRTVTNSRGGYADFSPMFSRKGRSARNAFRTTHFTLPSGAAPLRVEGLTPASTSLSHASYPSTVTRYPAPSGKDPPRGWPSSENSSRPPPRRTHHRRPAPFPRQPWPRRAATTDPSSPSGR